MSKPYLCFSPKWFIVKVAGDNHSPHEFGQPGAATKHYFVVDNACFESFSEATVRAKSLAKKTPGNRYYVVKMQAGYMAHEPKFDERSYY